MRQREQRRPVARGIGGGCSLRSKLRREERDICRDHETDRGDGPARQTADSAARTRRTGSIHKQGKVKRCDCQVIKSLASRFLLIVRTIVFRRPVCWLRVQEKETASRLGIGIEYGSHGEQSSAKRDFNVGRHVIMSGRVGLLLVGV